MCTSDFHGFELRYEVFNNWALDAVDNEDKPKAAVAANLYWIRIKLMWFSS